MVCKLNNLSLNVSLKLIGLTCSSSYVKELDRFQSSETGKLQGRDDYMDTKRVSEMLHAQTELKHKMKDYVTDHHEETYMSDAWGNDSVGLGSGLW